MKINKMNLSSINPYQSNELKMKKSAHHQQSQKDKLEISSEAKQLSEITSYGADRKSYVQNIKNQIDTGTYEPNAEQIAKSLLKFYQ